MSDILTPEELESWLLPSPAQQRELVRAWSNETPLDWGGWMIRGGASIHPASQFDMAPSESGIYGLCDETGGLLYIGKAVDLCRRLFQHRQNMAFRGGMSFAAFCFRQVPEYAVRDVEVAHIYALEPELNRLYEPGRWSGHKAMARAIRESWGIEE